MFISKDLLLKKSVMPSRWAIMGLVALPLWVQAQTVISAPKPTVRPQPVQVESVAPAIAPVNPPVPKGSDAIRVLSEIEGLREELAALRNEIEVQQHELEKLGKRQRELIEDTDKRLNRQAELVSTTKEQLADLKTETADIKTETAELKTETAELKTETADLKTETADLKTETAEKIASLNISEANQKTPTKTTQPQKVVGVPGGGVGKPQLTEPAPARPGIQPPVTSLPKSGGPTVSPGSIPDTAAAVPTTHPPSGISVTNANIASPILTPRSNQPVGSAARPVAVGGGLGSASPGRVRPVPGGPMGQVATGTQAISGGQVNTSGRDTVAINTRRPTAGQINAPVSDPAAEQAAYENAFELLKQSRYNEAIRGFNNLLLAYPGSTLADDAQYWIAEAHYVTRGLESALLGFRTVVARYPSSPRVADAMLRIGYIQYEVGAYNQARQTLTELVTRYPSSRVAVSAETRLKKMIQESR